jgi:hypothetical protein
VRLPAFHGVLKSERSGVLETLFFSCASDQKGKNPALPRAAGLLVILFTFFDESLKIH